MIHSSPHMPKHSEKAGKIIRNTNSSNIMPILLAYFTIIIIWSTTPLAIAWSGLSAGFVFAVSSRMLLGLVLALCFLALFRQHIQWHKRAKLAYLYAGLGIYGSMLAVYWAAQFIPSGWVSLLFGLTPIFTALMASLWLQEDHLTPYKIGGMALGFLGLLLVFGQSISWGDTAIWGVCGVLLSGLIHAASAVWVKRTQANVPALSMTIGSLYVATPLFLLTWLCTQPQLGVTWYALQHAPLHTSLSIIYLALFGSVLGFSLYFYVLQRIEATRVALIALITPITSLLLGNQLNQEPITMPIMMGALLIISGLALFELGGKPLPKWIPFRPQ